MPQFWSSLLLLHTPTLPSWCLPTAEHCPLPFSSPVTCSPGCPFPKSSHPLPLVSSDRPVARGRGPQHGQPPLRLQHLRQSFQHHVGRHHHPGKRGFSGLQLQLPRVPPPQALALRLPREQKIGMLITAQSPIYGTVIALQLLFAMEMLSAELLSSWGRGRAAAAVCRCLAW